MATLQENVAARKKARETKAAPIQTPIIQTPRSNVTREASYTPGTQNATVAPQVDPGYDSRGAGNPVYKTTEELTGAFTSQNTRKAELQKQLSSGQLSQDDYNREISQMFTQDQYDAALRNIESGYGGVDPLGFGNKNLAGVGPYKTLEEAEAAAEAERVKTGTVTPETQAAIYAFQNPTQYQGASGEMNTPRGSTERAAAGDPLKSAQSGAGGRKGALGFNTIEEINKKEEEAINNARQTGGAGYGGDVKTAEQAIRATFDAERKKEMDRIDTETKKAEFAAANAKKMESEAAVAPPMESFAVPTLDESIANLTALTQNSSGIQHDVFNAYLPALTGLLTRLKSVRMQAESIDTAAERSALAEAQIAPEVALANRREQQFLSRKAQDDLLLKENRDIMLEANKLTTESLEIDKKIAEEKNRISEIRQMALNAEGEKKLRRSLNDLGIENSPNSVNYLQGKIQEAADTLSSMIQTNSLTILKYDVARKGLNNELRGILNEFDSKKALLNANFDDNIFNLDQFISGARSNALSGLKKDWQNLLVKEDELMKEAGDKIAEAGIKAVELQESANKQDALDRRATERMEFQESQANKRMAMQLNNQERMQSNADKNAERASADDIRSHYRNVTTNKVVQEYFTLSSTMKKMDVLIKDAKGSKDPEKIGAMKELNLTLTAKFADPTTGVRDNEIDKFGKAQSWVTKVKNTYNAIQGGDMTGVSMDMVNAYMEAVRLSTSAVKEEAAAQIYPVINQIITHNNRAQYMPFNPSDIIPMEFLNDATEAWNSYSSAEARTSGSYNFEWNAEPTGGGETEFGKGITSLGRLTQGFDTPIASKEDGGLYSSSTVEAWGGVHAGVDIAVPQGSDFVSLVDGEIIEIGEEPGWGGTIVIKDANGAEHRVSHLSKIDPALTKGSFVNRGSLIAKTGGGKGTQGAGNSTGPHIDYRIRKDGKYINPLDYNA